MVLYPSCGIGHMLVVEEKHHTEGRERGTYHERAEISVGPGNSGLLFVESAPARIAVHRMDQRVVCA